ncbi:hypothetical protein QLQ15_03210 [Lysobacter sp. LF1]|uniref:Uncharacterized protein n=1 Tax=Lysobacter stagni TaxID=3045172 RepID=A0ABT6XCN7_9GAMM|nr:hypothetical protein [Lysobacter sp. LF1]MDI9237914.1 hypothetical protein [Lysobacter sp. LF1]
MQTINTEQEARTEAKPRTVPMTRHAAMKLVDLLATSDEFRNVFMRDARMALETWQFDQDTIDWFWFDCKMGSPSWHRKRSSPPHTTRSCRC